MRTEKSAALSRFTRAAYGRGSAILLLHGGSAAPDVVDELRQHLEMLQRAPRVRIGAARRLQGAASRRQTAVQTLFECCNEVRTRIKRQFRAAQYSSLRRAFGLAFQASPKKPQTVLAFAAMVLAAAPAHAAELRQLRILEPTLLRISRLSAALQQSSREQVEYRVQRRQVVESLHEIAQKVNAICDALSGAGDGPPPMPVEVHP